MLVRIRRRFDRKRLLAVLLGTVVLVLALTVQPPQASAQGTQLVSYHHVTMRPNSVFLGMIEPQRFHLNRMALQPPMGWHYPVFPCADAIGHEYDPDEPVYPENGESGENIKDTIDRDIRTILEEMNNDPGIIRGQIGAYPGNNTFWLDVTHIQNRTGGDRHSAGYGIADTQYQLGVDLMRRTDRRFGAVLAYGSPTLRQSGNTSAAEHYQFGGYCQLDFGGIEVNGWIGYANQQIDARRRVGPAEGIVPEGADWWYRGSTTGNSFSTCVELGKVTCYRGCFFLRPGIGVEMNHAWQGGYMEDAPITSGRIRYGKMHLEQTYLRVGLRAKYESFTWLTALVRVEYAYMMQGDPIPKVNATFLDEPGVPTYRIAGVDVGRDYLTLGGGFQCQLGRAGTRFAFADYSATASPARTIQLISVGYMEKF